jgi:hypothetical protein
MFAKLLFGNLETGEVAMVVPFSYLVRLCSLFLIGCYTFARVERGINERRMTGTKL